MYAVIRTGGKQYRVAENQRLTVERLPGDPGETLKLDDVLMIAEDESAPILDASGLSKAAVFAEVVAQTRGDKVIVFKKNRRKNYRRTKGHRQEQTMLRIASISASGEAPAASKVAMEDEASPEAAAETPAPEAQQAEAQEAKEGSAVEPEGDSTDDTTSEATLESQSKE